mmetsp:Transcript_66586/g.145157  ORF Transcript_66586/g.145157 Transcript_66586/m.145157 type:complete len:116 (-) Transcript_66586:274-621(-)
MAHAWRMHARMWAGSLEDRPTMKTFTRGRSAGGLSDSRKKPTAYIREHTAASSVQEREALASLTSRKMLRPRKVLTSCFTCEGSIPNVPQPEKIVSEERGMRRSRRSMSMAEARA